MTARGGHPSTVFRPLSLALLALLLAGLLCLVPLALSPERIDLFHAAFFNVCTMRAYHLHWQHAQRVPQTLRYDFTLSPDSFVLVAVWLHDGPTLSFSRPLPQRC